MKLGLVLCGLLWCASSAGAQTVAPQGEKACVLEKTTYVCNARGFRHALQAAQTVALDTEPRDKAAVQNLEALAAKLHKTVVPREQADVIFALHPVGSNGFVLGPGDNELARLQVFTAGHEGRPNELLWSESYFGDPDRPWPSTLIALVMQFEDQVRAR